MNINEFLDFFTDPNQQNFKNLKSARIELEKAFQDYQKAGGKKYTDINSFRTGIVTLLKDPEWKDEIKSGADFIKFEPNDTGRPKIPNSIKENPDGTWSGIIDGKTFNGSFEEVATAIQGQQQNKADTAALKKFSQNMAGEKAWQGKTNFNPDLDQKPKAKGTWGDRFLKKKQGAKI